MDPARKGKVLDEDDDFEEFPADHWGPDQQDLNDSRLWDKTWDDHLPKNEDEVGQQIKQVAEQLKAGNANQQAKQQ
jgi:hypothetical protein